MSLVNVVTDPKNIETYFLSDLKSIETLVNSMRFAQPRFFCATIRICLFGIGG